MPTDQLNSSKVTKRRRKARIEGCNVEIACVGIADFWHCETFEAKKPIAAICHAPWLLIEADIIRGRRATSYHSFNTDMKNAGVECGDEHK